MKLKIVMISAFFFILIFRLSSIAEVIMDGTCGIQGEISGPEYFIKDEYGKLVGTNLFHSFEFFNIHTNEKAIFSASPDISIQNIISRVTGGSVSLIDGTIQSNIDGANLYLLNPSGVMFGPNASINIDGSFHVSTADYLKMGGQKFFASPQMNISEFSSSNPTAFGFLDNKKKGDIVINGTNIEMLEDKTLSIVGGDIEILNGGVLSAPKGRINIASMAVEGMVGIKEVGDAPLDYANIKSNENYDNTSINIINSQINSSEGYIDISTSGHINDILDNQINATDVSLYNSIIQITNEKSHGEIYIRGNNCFLENSMISYLDQTIENNNKSIALNFKGGIGISSNGSIICYAGGEGKGPDLIIESETLFFANGGKLLTLTEGIAESGDVSIKIQGDMFIDGFDIDNPISDEYKDEIRSGIYHIAQNNSLVGSTHISAKNLFLQNFGTIKYILKNDAKSGKLNIYSDFLTIKDNAEINTSLIDNVVGGNINIDSTNTIIDNGQILSDVNNWATGSDISIFSNSLELLNGGSIKYFKKNSAEGGKIDIVIDEMFLINGYSIVASPEITHMPSGIHSVNYDSSKSDIINISTSNLTLSDGGVIIGSSFADIKGSDIIITASNSVNILGTTPGLSSGIYNGSYTTKNDFGLIKISTPIINLSNKGTISGKGSNIGLTTIDLEIKDGANIDSSPRSGKPGNAGNIIINSENITIQGYYVNEDNLTISSNISTCSDGEDNSGNISIYSKSLKILNKGKIKTDTYGTGEGGDIHIESSYIELNKCGRLSSDTYNDGNGGNIVLKVDKLNVLSSSSISTSVIGEEKLWKSLMENIREKFGYEITSGHPGEGRGTGGNIDIIASNSIVLSGIDNSISTSTSGRNTSGKGNGGNIKITSPILVISDASWINSGTYMDSSGKYMNNGNAGNIQLDIDRHLSLIRGGQICATTSSEGIGGSIKINSKNLSISGKYNDSKTLSAIQNRSLESGDAGNTTINISNLKISNGGRITSDSEKNGIAGKIDINATNKLELFSDSSISTKTEKSDGGDININLGNLLHMSESSINTSVKDNIGDGGNISIDNPKFIVLDSSYIIANTYEGRGGNISIQSDNYFQFPDSLVNASSKKGISGEVNIQSSVKDISSGLTLLPESFFDATPLIKESCSAKVHENENSFLIGSRESFPALAYGYLFDKSCDENIDECKVTINLLNETIDDSKKIKDSKTLSFAHGILGNIYKKLGKIDEAITETRRAIFWSQKIYSPEIEFFWQAQLGRIWKKNNKEKAIMSYKNALSLLGDTLQNNKFNTNEILKPFNTRYEIINYETKSQNQNDDFFSKYVKPVYYEIFEILLNKSQSLFNKSHFKEASKIREEALETLELLKNFEMQEFFKDECAIKSVPMPLTQLQEKTALIQLFRFRYYSDFII